MEENQALHTLSIIAFSTKKYDQEFLEKSIEHMHTGKRIQINYLETCLDERTVNLTKGYEAIIVNFPFFKFFLCLKNFFFLFGRFL
jgi:tRNA1(Val) A37 N6-methylase TrmN6